MSSASVRRLAILAIAIVGALGVAGTASAASPFGCRASVSATRPGSPAPAIEPYVANRPENPCVTDSAGVSSGSTGSPAAGSGATAGPGAAYTYSTDQPAPGSTALASVNGGSIASPGNSVVLPGPAQAQASYACVAGKAVASGSSNASAVTVNGKQTSPSSPGAEQTTQLGGGSYVTINQQVRTATSLTQRVVFEHIAGVGDYVLGEAQVTLARANPCAGTAGAGGSGAGSGAPDLSACPAGSTLVASAQLCEIVLAGGNSIVVSRPFQGPTGGTVVALAVARKKYKSACLYGPGPKYAVVGTNHADRITGTNRADRILGRGGKDVIAGRGGNDCIDGGPGNDRITDGNGKSRVYGGPGNDTISAGRGRARVWGGAGKDTIRTGRGNDWVWGGPGNDRIIAGKGRDHLFGGPGNDRLSAPGKISWVNGGPGRDVAYVRASGMRYARRHGVEKVHRIR